MQYYQMLYHQVIDIYTKCQGIISNVSQQIFKMVLTQSQAQSRSKCIKTNSIHYNLHVSLQASSHYSGLSEASFELVVVPQQLFLDCRSPEVKKVWLNGEVMQQPKTEAGFIFLDTTKLRVGQNCVQVHYRNTYNDDGSGCVSFIDVDTKQYLYTQMEPYYANRVFALFDQPDLKAKMNLNVIEPATWKKVLSNEYPIVEQPFAVELYRKTVKTAHQAALVEYLADKQGNMVLFPASKLLPTYLYCFIAGEYKQLKLQKTYKDIPMSLYCIESLYEHMKELAPFMFEITIESMKFFEAFFGYPYSFAKYDQVFAHEYKWGAMENAGIVTFNDMYIFREKVSTDRLLSLANTVSHELAHHWFGNLVTMRWWDDLWLNESFADFISHFCLQKIKNNCKTINYQSSMAAFIKRKAWGYSEDEMTTTTHSIRGPVANTSVADSIFDGITYAKGAATMKQLLFLMSEENFSKALSVYFTKYEWANATIDDFLAQMQKFFPIKHFTLQDWRQMWLQAPSLNSIQAIWNPADRNPKSILKIKQTAITPVYPTLRYHMIKVCFFRKDLTKEIVSVLLHPRQETTLQYDGTQEFAAILLNYQDHTFAKNVIDSVSIDFFTHNLNKIDDILSRTLIWRSFFDMVKDGQITSNKYLQIILKCLSNESSDSIFESQLNCIHAAINTYTPRRLREPLNSRMFLYITSLVPSLSPQHENRLVILRDKIVSFATTEAQKYFLLDWASGRVPFLAAQPMSVGQRWSTVVKAYTIKSLTLQQKEALFEEQRVRDPSDTAKNKRAYVDGLKATPAEFQQIYRKLREKNSDLSLTIKKNLAHGWNSLVHQDKLVGYRERYFSDVVDLSEVLEGDYFEFFYQYLAPDHQNFAELIAQYEKISLPKGKCDAHIINIKKIIEGLKQKQKCYALYESKAHL